MLHGMNRTRRAKTGSRRLTTRRGMHVELLPGTPEPLDRALSVPSLEEVLASVDRMADLSEWAEARERVMPIFPRAHPRQAVPGEGEAVTVQLPPGVTVAFGIDLGMAFAHITRPLLAA